MTQKPIILVANDDGYRSNGIAMLASIAGDFGEVYTIAPDREQSAAGHSLTIHRPLRVEPEGPNLWSVDGTPTDCVHLGLLSNILPKRPTLVLSGINHGSNLGDEITYSGTVAGAMEGCLLGAPSVAFSCESSGHSRNDLAPLAPFVAHVIRFVLQNGLPRGTLLNVNFPDPRRGPILGLKVASQGSRVYGAEVVEKTDPRQRRYYWIGGELIDTPGEAGSDVEAVAAGYAAVTPIHLKLTDHTQLERLKRLGIETLAAG